MKGYYFPENEDGFDGIAKTFIEEANRANIPVEPTSDKAKHMIKNDLRDALPPQLYALISMFTKAIEQISESK